MSWGLAFGVVLREGMTRMVVPGYCPVASARVAP